LEPWITPSIFEPYANGGGVVDEYTLSATLGKSAAQSLLEQHWGNWITEQDFAGIAAAGLNTVRIPIGYWALWPQPGDPYVQGQLSYLGNALGWARNHGLKVVLDLHGGMITPKLEINNLLTYLQHRDLKTALITAVDLDQFSGKRATPFKRRWLQFITSPTLP
jgi:hypothetical protein